MFIIIYIFITIFKNKAKDYIKKEIDNLTIDKYESGEDAFNYIYSKIEVFNDLKILNKNDLNILWEILQNKIDNM